jgi:uncharacterized protein (TIGR00375 family)
MEDNEKEIKENWVFSDLHIHSRFSRACSKDLTIPSLVKWARIKGLNLLGTGDFTHPKWLQELKERLKEQNGILWYNYNGEDLNKSEENKRFPFILSSEISLVYTDNNKGRRVHLVYLAPSFEVVDKINQYLDTKGRRDYDGRPIFKISCRDFVADMQKIDEKIEVIPAHIWTPWFGVFGSKGGYDSLNEAFKDKRDRIHAIETGISSNPAMNWKIKDLENISIVSFSDSHSFWPFRLGRESTIFKLEKTEKLSYDLILKQIRENSFIGTIETDPAYGKYHFDGHLGCGFSCGPEKTKELNRICPKCSKPLVIGVDYRVNELASKDADNKSKKKYYTILPLHEILSLGLGVGMNAKKTWDVYNKLIEKFGNEFNILLNISKEEIIRILGNNLLADLIIKNRHGKINVVAGYDGSYGKAVLERDGKAEIDEKRGKDNNQSNLVEKQDKSVEKQKKLF